MKTHRFLSLTLLAIGVLFIIGEVLAGPRPGYPVDGRFRHGVAYPKIGFQINVLPPHYAMVPHRRVPYYYYGGVWYNSAGPGYVVVRPPVGVIAPILPPAYTTIWYQGVPYYYGNNTYYIWKADQNGYAVVEPPPDIQADKNTTLLANELYVYPKLDQSEEQRSDDRFACHQWAVKETGYDPSRPSENMSRSELEGRRSNYQRAIRACLEGKGYSVR